MMPIFEEEDFDKIPEKMEQLRKEEKEKRLRKDEKDSDDIGDLYESFFVDFEFHCESCGFLVTNEVTCGNCGEKALID